MYALCILNKNTMPMYYYLGTLEKKNRPRKTEVI